MTAETKATDTDKPKVVRITVPATDEVTMDFLEAQGPRGVTTAVRLLIHSFVAEHGNVDVLSAVSGSLVGTRPITPAVVTDPAAEQASEQVSPATTSTDVSDTTDQSDSTAAARLDRNPGTRERVAEALDHLDQVDQVSVPASGPGLGSDPEVTGMSDDKAVSENDNTGVPDGGSSVSDMEDLFRRAGKK